MNQQLSVKKYVEWKIAIPFNNASPITSPNFRLLGSEWYFEMRFEMDVECHFNKNLRENYYNIYLCERNDNETLQKKSLKKSFDIIIFIKMRTYELANRAVAFVDYSEKRIARYSSSIIRSYLQKGFEPSGEESVLELFFILNFPASDTMDKIESNFSVTTDKAIQAHFDVPCDLESLSLDLSNLLSNEASPSDVVVRCGERTSRAHRAVLAARSEVFAAVFRNNMAESETGVVEITDMDGADFELFLKFVYSGKIQIPSEESATSLYAAGDKYAIPFLKRVCSGYLARNLNPENCLRFLAMSERHGDEPFTGAALNFVAENLDGLDREEWSSFSAEYSKLAVKVYEKRFKATLSKQVSHKKMKCME